MASKATKPKAAKNGNGKNGTGKNGNGKKRPWTDADKERAIAVYVTTGNLSRTSRETGVPISTLRDWLKEQPAEKVKEAREEAQVAFVKQAWSAVGEYVDHLRNSVTMKTATARDSATIVGILIDKIQLVTGKPTAINEQQGQVTNRHEYDIVQRIVTDPEDREVARNLFRRGISSVSEGLGGGRTA